MARNLVIGALALTLLSGGAFAQGYGSQPFTTEGIPPAPAPGVTRSTTTETTRGVSGTEVRRSEYQSNPATGTTRSTSERHVQGPDGTISSSSVRREERAVLPPPPPPPTETIRTTTTTTTVR